MNTAPGHLVCEKKSKLTSKNWLLIKSTGLSGGKIISVGPGYYPLYFKTNTIAIGILAHNTKRTWYLCVWE